jgi:hypothetical protein
MTNPNTPNHTITRRILIKRINFESESLSSNMVIIASNSNSNKSILKSLIC